ncbi:Ger(x)C family spore germination protein [Bacillus sp. B190/17]|uniref:Ger(X)C family spore germination protein n=1 Tax=Bacillus lumedeiriae TaxID=3058829 RepID=A0ABW8ID07_9BACI
MKRILLLCSLSGSLFLLTGCWDRTEINDLAIVTAAAIDKKGDKQIQLSLQVVVPKSLGGGSQQGGGQGGGAGKTTLVTSQTGANVAEALSKIQSELPRKVFWGQCKVFIFGEKAAKDGIHDHVDFLLRHPQPRERADVFVSKGKAKRILELQTRLERDSSETVREQVKLGIGMKVTLQTMDEMLTGEARAAALPYLKVATEKDDEGSYEYPKIFATAVFKKDRMIGHLSQKKTRGLLWIRNEVKNYTITVKTKELKGSISLNPVSIKVDLIPKIQGEKWKMFVKVQTEGSVIQNGTNLDLNNPKSLAKVTTAYEDAIKKRIGSAIKPVQHELKADIVDFGKEFHRKYPKQWRRVAHRWDEVLPEVEVDVDVKAHILRQGNINESEGRREVRKQ